jgi:hypothetical protein
MREEYKATMLAKVEHVHDRRHKDVPPETHSTE